MNWCEQRGTRVSTYQSHDRFCIPKDRMIATIDILRFLQDFLDFFDLKWQFYDDPCDLAQVCGRLKDLKQRKLENGKSAYCKRVT